MPSTLKQILKEVTFEILETMFFALPEPLPDDGGLLPGLVFDLRASVALGGRQNLALNLFLPKPLAADLTASFLGLEPDEIDDGAVSDMAKEMINMVAGNLLNRIGEQAGFEMGIPQAVFGKRTLTQETLAENKNVFICVDDQFLMLSFSREDG